MLVTLEFIMGQNIHLDRTRGGPPLGLRSKCPSEILGNFRKFFIFLLFIVGFELACFK